MVEPVHLFLVAATFSLIIQATRRTMAGAFTPIALACLVMSIVMLAVKNKNLKNSADEERRISFRSMEEKASELDACQKTIESKRQEIENLEIRITGMQEKNDHLMADTANLRKELSEGAHLAKTVEELHAEVARLTANSEKLQADLDSALGQVSALRKEKDELQVKLADALQKVGAAGPPQQAAVLPPIPAPQPQPAAVPAPVPAAVPAPVPAAVAAPPA